MQDASKLLLGVPLSSARDVSRFDNDPASFPAGLAVRLNSSGGLSLLKADGMLIGVSLGRNLSDTLRTAVARAGESVPMRASLKRASGVITISSYANLVSTSGDTIGVAGVDFIAQSSAITPGDATFQAATSNNATAASLAAQINANATAKAKVYAVASSATVTLYSIADGVGSTGTGNDIAVAYTDNGGGNIGATLSGLSGGKLAGGSNLIADVDYMTIGAMAYINDVTGKLDANISGFTSISNAIYVSEVLTGVAEDSSSVAAAAVDMPGGL